MRVRVVSVNVNGIRAAQRRGGLAELAGLEADLICMQEVRASAAIAQEVLSNSELCEYRLVTSAGPRPGHAGVAVLVRPGLRLLPTEPDDTRLEQGRWLAAAVNPGPPATGAHAELRLATAYVPTGAGGGAAAVAKAGFLAAVGDWLAANAAVPALLAGDLNVAHTCEDIANWRGNVGKPGFLPEERGHLDRWLAPQPSGLGWVDGGRFLAGPGPGPYTWWSWRGRAFDNDSGWRIDYLLLSPPLAGALRRWRVLRAPSYAQRWSDHAAVMADLELADAAPGRSPQQVVGITPAGQRDRP